MKITPVLSAIHGGSDNVHHAILDICLCADRDVVAGQSVGAAELNRIVVVITDGGIREIGVPGERVHNLGHLVDALKCDQRRDHERRAVGESDGVSSQAVE